MDYDAKQKEIMDRYVMIFNVAVIKWVNVYRFHCATRTIYILNAFFCRMPHKCHGNGNNCPSRSQPIWELPINELDRREDPSFDERLSGCHLVSSCSNVYDPAQFKTLLEHNFNRYLMYRVLESRRG